MAEAELAAAGGGGGGSRDASAASRLLALEARMAGLDSRALMEQAGVVGAAHAAGVDDHEDDEEDDAGFGVVKHVLPPAAKRARTGGGAAAAAVAAAAGPVAVARGGIAPVSPMPAGTGSRGYDGMAVFGSAVAAGGQQQQAGGAARLPAVVDLTGRSSPDGGSRGGASRHSSGLVGMENEPLAAAAAVAAAARIENEAAARQLAGARAESEAAGRRAGEAERRAAAAEQRALEAEARLAAVAAEKKRVEGELERSTVGHRAALSRALLREAALERDAQRAALQAEAPRVGRVTVQRQGASLVEVWEEGTAHRALEARTAALADERAAIERARKALRKRHLPPPAAGASSGAAAAAAAAEKAASGETALRDAEFLAADALVTARLETLRKQETALAREKERLEAEKVAHIRELRRQRDEDASRLGSLGHALGADPASPRYVLNRLLGKGGFSEVFKAYDLASLGDVAVKVHQLDANWSEERKSSYVRHAVREYHIHKAMEHPNICELRDIFEVDANTFATVLEHCPGGDLDSHLKASAGGVLPEREARAIIVAVFSGLLYLADREKPIIHYDLVRRELPACARTAPTHKHVLSARALPGVLIVARPPQSHAVADTHRNPETSSSAPMDRSKSQTLVCQRSSRTAAPPAWSSPRRARGLTGTCRRSALTRRADPKSRPRWTCGPRASSCIRCSLADGLLRTA